MRRYPWHPSASVSRPVSRATASAKRSRVCSPAQIKAFEGRKIRTVGLFENKTPNDPKLYRWIMWCCAADAIPVSVELAGNTAGNWSDTQYLEVVGTATFPSTLGQVVPRIQVDTIKPVPDPDDPYLSP